MASHLCLAILSTCFLTVFAAYQTKGGNSGSYYTETKSNPGYSGNVYSLTQKPASSSYGSGPQACCPEDVTYCGYNLNNKKTRDCGITLEANSFYKCSYKVPTKVGVCNGNCVATGASKDDACVTENNYGSTSSQYGYGSSGSGYASNTAKACCPEDVTYCGFNLDNKKTGDCGITLEHDSLYHCSYKVPTKVGACSYGQQCVATGVGRDDVCQANQASSYGSSSQSSYGSNSAKACCPEDVTYCGFNLDAKKTADCGINLEHDALYKCYYKVPSKVGACAYGQQCVATGAGRDDVCQANQASNYGSSSNAYGSMASSYGSNSAKACCPEDVTYCGFNLDNKKTADCGITLEHDSLYHCSYKVPTKVGACSYGQQCVATGAGRDDICQAPSNNYGSSSQSSGSSYGSNSAKACCPEDVTYCGFNLDAKKTADCGITLEHDSLYKCYYKVPSKIGACAYGQQCVATGAGRDDVCQAPSGYGAMTSSYGSNTQNSYGSSSAKACCPEDVTYCGFNLDQKKTADCGITLEPGSLYHCSYKVPTKVGACTYGQQCVATGAGRDDVCQAANTYGSSNQNYGSAMTSYGSNSAKACCPEDVTYCGFNLDAKKTADCGLTLEHDSLYKCYYKVPSKVGACAYGQQCVATGAGRDDVCQAQSGYAAMTSNYGSSSGSSYGSSSAKACCPEDVTYCGFNLDAKKTGDCGMSLEHDSLYQCSYKVPTKVGACSNGAQCVATGAGKDDVCQAQKAYGSTSYGSSSQNSYGSSSAKACCPEDVTYCGFNLDAKKTADCGITLEHDSLYKCYYKVPSKVGACSYGQQCVATGAGRDDICQAPSNDGYQGYGN